MPKQDIDYAKTLMYKLVCRDLNVKESYVGSTTDFKSRKACHKSDCNNENSKNYNYKVYEYIRANGGFQNFEMIEIEKYPCQDKNESSARERYWKEHFNATLNVCVPARTQKEYYADNADKIKQVHKQYYVDNADKIKQVHKQYREENKEQISQQRKQYRIKQKNKNTTLTVNESRSD